MALRTQFDGELGDYRFQVRAAVARFTAEEKRHDDWQKAVHEFRRDPHDGFSAVSRELVRGATRARRQEGGATVPRPGRRHQLRALSDDAEPALPEQLPAER